ncbi:hypothetical protein [Brumimicrobium oceani]|uniref:Uncharacterized protein n=1 Tax=Brumimicrobium oceani TaxID=2100725 RepID=A0A2U2X0B6_9FLAO|nr:hypothetical protein [Brumimicrobium oceani]PWH81211.1 hypothetical protein DIT68_16015 [Brumimicrobium oceani]
METGNILIGVISIVAIVIPFILMYRKSKKTERGLLKNLKIYADTKGLQIEKWEAMGNLILGIDSINRVAYFAEVENLNYKVRHVQLSEMSICKVNRELREVDYHGEKDRVTHSVEIDFYPKNKKNNVESFRLFDEDNNRMLSGEIQLAEEWVAKYNELISSPNATSNVSVEHKMAVG